MSQQINHILVATDLTPESETVDAHALVLAHRLSAKITFLFVDTLPSQYERLASNMPTAGMPVVNLQLLEPSKLKEQALAQLKNRIGKISPSPVLAESCELVVRQGLADDEILSELQRPEARYDLLVVGRKHRSGVAEFLLGATGLRLVEKVKVPVLVLPAEKDLKSVAIGRIAVATSLTEMHHRSELLAADLCAATGATLELVHVLEGYDSLARSLSAQAVADAPSEFYRELEMLVLSAQENARLRLEERARELRPLSQSPVKPVLLEGSVTENLLAHARKDGLGLFVMGQHAKPALMSIFMGSTARALLQKVHAPLLVVPTPA